MNNQTGATTVQATSKYWKGAKAMGVVLFITGFAVPPELGMWFLLLGVATFLYGMIGGWWNHS